MMNTAFSHMPPTPSHSNGTSRPTSTSTTAFHSASPRTTTTTTATTATTTTTAKHPRKPHDALGLELAILISSDSDSDSDIEISETSSLSDPPQHVRTPPPFLSPIPLKFEERAKRKLAGALSSGEDSDIMDESDEEIRDLLRRTREGGRKTRRPGGLLGVGVVSPAVRRTRKELDGVLSPLRNHTSSVSHSFSASTRMLRNGEVVVTNSDPESDDDEGVSSGSDKGLPGNKRDDNGGGNSDDDDDESESDIGNPDEIFTRVLRSSRARKQESPRKNDDEKPSTSKRVKFTGEKNTTVLAASLDELLRDSERDKEITEKVAKANASISRYTLDKDNNYIIHTEETDEIDSGGRSKSKQHKVSWATHRRRLTEDIISTTIDDGDEEKVWKAERLSRAVDRTEVFSQGKVWLFFSEDAPDLAPPEFPNFQEKAWNSGLKESPQRNRAVLSGLVGDCLSKPSGHLPDQIIPWLMESITSETQDLLRDTYCATLKRANASRISGAITSATIDKLFSRLGAKPAALAMAKPMEHDDSLPQEYQKHDRRYLLSVLYVLEVIADRLNDETRSHALKLVLRLAADEAIMGLSAIYMQTQRTIGSLIINSTDAALSDIATWLFQTVPNPEFQSLILRCIPSLNRRTARFRCRFASAFLYNDKQCLTQPFETLFNIPRIVDFLEKDKRFDVTRHKLQQQQQREEEDLDSSDSDETVDYYELAALASILSIAIDNGRSTSEPFSSKEEETRFNEQIDGLASMIKGIFSNIQDSGASHMKRLEAKERLQMLYYRVLYGVRTQGIKKKSVFMTKSREGGNSDLMAKFLGKKT